jgi:dihydrofolate reductase
MRKLILGLAVSLDSFIEGPNGEYDWCFTDQDYGLSDFLKRVDVIFMGRKSYEEAKKYESQNPWKGMTTYVFSNTMKETPADVKAVLGGNIPHEIKKLKQQEGKDIWLFGGAQLVTTLLNAELIDEFWLSVHPVLLGKGKPLFQNLANRKNLVLKEHKVYSSGLVSLVYQQQ